MYERLKRIHTFLTGIQEKSYKKCHTVISVYANGDISFGVYSEGPRLWFFYEMEEDEIVNEKMKEIQSYLGY